MKCDVKAKVCGCGNSTPKNICRVFFQRRCIYLKVLLTITFAFKAFCPGPFVVTNNTEHYLPVAFEEQFPSLREVECCI